MSTVGRVLRLLLAARLVLVFTLMVEDVDVPFGRRWNEVAQIPKPKFESLSAPL